jgi:hypothetical protein
VVQNQKLISKNLLLCSLCHRLNNSYLLCLRLIWQFCRYTKTYGVKWQANYWKQVAKLCGRNPLGFNVRHAFSTTVWLRELRKASSTVSRQNLNKDSLKSKQEFTVFLCWKPNPPHTPHPLPCQVQFLHLPHDLYRTKVRYFILSFLAEKFWFSSRIVRNIFYK